MGDTAGSVAHTEHLGRPNPIPGRELRVAHITPSYFPAHTYGGPIASVHQLCLGLARLGTQVRVLTTDSNGLGLRLNLGGNEITTFEPGLQVRYCRRILRHSVSFRLLSLLKSYVDWSDIVHLTAVFSFPTIPTLLAASLASKPVVWSPRGALQRWPGSRRPISKSVWERVCAAVSSNRLVLHSTSDDERRSCALRFPRMRSVVVPNGVEIPAVWASPGTERAVRLVFLGRLDPKKGLENLLQACRLLRDRNVVFSLEIAGSGETDYVDGLKHSVNSSGLQTVVRFLGSVYGEAKTKLLCNSDILVCPSHTENFGLVVAEALAHGLPVITSRGTPWERVVEKQCGLWVANDPESLADAILRASSMHLTEMGSRGRMWMTNEFQWDRVAKQMHELYRSMIEGN